MGKTFLLVALGILVLALAVSILYATIGDTFRNRMAKASDPIEDGKNKVIAEFESQSTETATTEYLSKNFNQADPNKRINEMDQAATRASAFSSL
jgi:hypothetical protein